ncbi:MAG TPA: hypothetical protein PJ982_19750, partial [Lacipirellulaceae bacterium]|nr:hypothetical protein [Lacipirellulaceae bacterium]
MIRRRTGRRAYTLLELVVATGSSVIILGGLASALSISTHVLGPVVSAHDDGNRAAIVLSQLTADLRLAKRFTERTNRAVTFITPDRDG